MASLFRFLLVSFVFTLGTTIVVHAASFDCSKATTATEIAICNEPELSALDELMSKLYSQALRSNDWRYFDEDKDDSELINSQRLAIKSQIQCGGNNACLLKFYRSRIFEILTTLGLLENYGEDDAVKSLLRFSPEITSKNSIRALAASNDGSVEVLMVSEGDPENISRDQFGFYDYNLIKLIVFFTGSDGQPIQQVIEIGNTLYTERSSLEPTLDVRVNKFSIDQEHMFGFSTTEYERSSNNKWELTYEIYSPVPRGGPAFDLDVNHISDYSVGIEYQIYSYSPSYCEIVGQPTLLGDNSIGQLPTGFSTFIDNDNTSEAIENNVALNDFIDNLSDRDLRSFSIYAFYEYLDFELAKKGFEILASRDYAQSLDDLECVKSAIAQKGQ